MPRVRHRRAATVALAALLMALGAAAPAPAEVSSSFSSSVLLVRQPPARPWSVKLRVGAQFADTDGIDVQPVLQRLVFHVPDATVNAAGVPTCSADPIVSVANSYDPCPPRLAVGAGTSDVQLRRPLGIDLHGHPQGYAYHLRLAMYVGPRTGGGRVLMIIGNGVNSPMTVIMRGLLRRDGTGGWTYDLPIPLIRDPQIGVMKVERFAMSVGDWTRAHPRRWFLEAPRTCPPTGFAFTMDALFEGVAPLSTTRRTPCELLGV